MECLKLEIIVSYNIIEHITLILFKIKTETAQVLQTVKKISIIKDNVCESVSPTQFGLFANILVILTIINLIKTCYLF